MLRRVLLVALLALGATLAAAQAAPAYPPLASHSGDNAMCLLDKLELSRGLSIMPSFSSGRFKYMCSCLDWSKIKNTDGPQVTVNHIDPLSYSQIWFNGVPVNTLDKKNELRNTKPTSLALATPSNPWKTGRNIIQVFVQCELVEPTHRCEYQYIIECDKPPSQGGGVVGDPQFIGLRGQSFQVHGVAGEIYNIISDRDMQYNARFVFLHRGDCPVIDGRKQKGCWSHPGSYLGELGIKTRAGDRIRIDAGPAAEGMRACEINGRHLEIGETVELAGDMGTLTRNSTHLASVQIGNWEMAFESSDMFINQRVRVRDARQLRSHGLLGQTWREQTYPNAIKYIEGAVDDYSIRSKDIFGDNFVFNAFN